LKRFAALLLMLLAVPVWAQVSVENAWARATPPGAKVGGGYLTVVNRSSAPDRLVAVTSPAAGRVEMHVTEREGEVMKMRQVSAFEIPAGGRFEARPGGPHLMFFELKQPLKEGEKLPVTLKFERAGEVSAELHVAPLGAMRAPHGH
jgi:periplasmic copper chaperone A